MLDEVAKDNRAGWAEFGVVDVAVKRLVECVDEFRHGRNLSFAELHLL